LSGPGQWRASAGRVTLASVSPWGMEIALAGEDWRTAPPPQQQQPGSAWPAASPPVTAPAYSPYPAAQSRDWAYTIGEPLLKLVRLLSRVPFGWLLLIGGWGISLPALILTRASWPQAARLALAVAVLAGWVALIVSQAMA
jgi:hypothetical protein